MASITFRNRRTKELPAFKIFRIGNNVKDKNLDFCLQHPSIDKLHATLTSNGECISLANQSCHGEGDVFVNGEIVEGVRLLTHRDAVNGCIKLRFGELEADLRFPAISTE